MPDPREFERLPEIWRRVRESETGRGGAPLMPRRKPPKYPLRRGGADATSSASRD